MDKKDNQMSQNVAVASLELDKIDKGLKVKIQRNAEYVEELQKMHNSVIKDYYTIMRNLSK